MANEIPELEKQSMRRFGLVTGAIVVSLFGLLFPWLLDRAYPIWPWVVTGLLWGGALLYPAALRPVYRIWMRIGLVLGWINTWLILFFVYYAVVLPMGIAMRMLGKDPMARRLDNKLGSYRVKSTNPPRDNLKRPF